MMHLECNEIKNQIKTIETFSSICQIQSFLKLI